MIVRSVVRHFPRGFLVASLALSLIPAASAHRVDELLQATLLSVAPEAVTAEITVTPGIEIANSVLARMDQDRDGSISAAEAETYARRVLKSVELSLDGRPLELKLLGQEVAPLDDARSGLGLIRVKARAELGRVADGPHEVLFRNRHADPEAAFLANALVPESPSIRILSQRRDDRQSELRVNYVLRATPATAATPSTRPEVGDLSNAGAGIERAMTLLASSTPEERNTVPLQLKASLAYKLLALQLMIGEMDHFGKSLGIKELQALSINDFREVYVAPVHLGFEGGLKTGNYFVGFHKGRLWTISKIRFRGGRSLLESQSEWSMTPSLLEKADAYLLATQWLAAVSVDLAGLESRYKPDISQLEVETRLLPKGNLSKRAGRGTSLLPLFKIKWEERTLAAKKHDIRTPRVEVTILGTTKELVELRIHDVDGSLSHRPLLQVPDGTEIDKLPDGPIQKLLEGRPRFNFDVLAEVFRTSKAYRERCRKLMFEESVYLGCKLGLFSDDSISMAEIRSGFVRPPGFGFGGNIVISNLGFSFNESGRISSLERQDRFGRGDTYEGLIQTASRIDANGALKLATEWAQAIGFDLAALEAVHRPTSVQESVRRDGSQIRTPFFNVYWGDENFQVLSFRIFGATPELLEFKVTDPTFLRRPILAITNANELINRPD